MCTRASRTSVLSLYRQEWADSLLELLDGNTVEPGDAAAPQKGHKKRGRGQHRNFWFLL